MSSPYSNSTIPSGSNLTYEDHKGRLLLASVAVAILLTAIYSIFHICRRYRDIRFFNALSTDAKEITSSFEITNNIDELYVIESDEESNNSKDKERMPESVGDSSPKPKDGKKENFIVSPKPSKRKKKDIENSDVGNSTYFPPSPDVSPEKTFDNKNNSETGVTEGTFV